MAAALQRVGFVSIRRCELSDSDDPMFSAVEEPSRFRVIVSDFAELAVQGVKAASSRAQDLP